VALIATVPAFAGLRVSSTKVYAAVSTMLVTI
jgi:hypothetical protein